MLVAVGDPGGTAATAIDNAWKSPVNTDGGIPSFIDLTNVNGLTTSNSGAGGGVVCDLYP